MAKQVDRRRKEKSMFFGTIAGLLLIAALLGYNHRFSIQDGS
jgi:hypothetical protein